MGLILREFLFGTHILTCARCHTHLATHDAIISKAFHGHLGRAYLMERMVNVVESEQAEDRVMSTGLHRVRTVSCCRCGETLGWKYERAYEESQKYKEGKYVLEVMQMQQSPSQEERS